MKLIKNEKLSDTNLIYTNENFLKFKYLYCKTSDREYDIYHIFKFENVLCNYPIKYKVSRYYYLCVPKNKSIKAFTYDSKSVIEISNKTELYQLSYEEFLNTYRVFIDCDGKYPNQLPSKIIQDR